MRDTDEQEGFALPAPTIAAGTPPWTAALATQPQTDAPAPLTNTAIVIKIMALLDQIK